MTPQKGLNPFVYKLWKCKLISGDRNYINACLWGGVGKYKITREIGNFWGEEWKGLFSCYVSDYFMGVHVCQNWPNCTV